MMILGYKGIGLISWMIRFKTWSKYSHIGIQLNDGSVIEAWHVGGVRHVATPWTDHNPKTEIDFFEIEGEFDEQKAEAFLISKLGLKYNLIGILGFVTRKVYEVKGKLFCSQLGMLFSIHIGLPFLERILPAKVPPGMMLTSPRLKLVKTVKGDPDV